MSRLVAVSNRVGPIRGTSAGGLAVGLVEALRQNHGLWFGWSGRTRPAGETRLQTRQTSGLTLATLDLSQDDYDDYYNGFSNRCLWPLFHFRGDLMLFERRYLAAYRRVNQQFAESLLPLLKRSDLIWVHDYHLFPLATELRALGARQRIGFFLHTPFPPADVLAMLPEHEWLIRSLFDYDLVGFQTEADLQRFHSYVEGYAQNGRVHHGFVSAWGRKLRARVFPIGIDPGKFQELACSASSERERLRMHGALSGRDMIIGVDRLDYSKGLLRRLAAYELLLERYPEAQRAIEFLQIAPISRGEVQAYHDFRRELEQTAAHINGRFAQADWTPVRYLNRALPRSTLAGLYRASRVGMVTPVRDGMNLVAKEYVAAQNPDDPGVLVLSRFAGAAQQMREALLVNPYDVEEVAETLQTARTMPLKERCERHALLMRGLMTQDIRRWRNDFVTTLTRGKRAEPRAKRIVKKVSLRRNTWTPNPSLPGAPSSTTGCISR